MRNLLKILFIYIPAIYGYWIFIFLVFIDDTQTFEYQDKDQISIVEIKR